MLASLSNKGASTSTAQARVANLESKLVRLLVDLAGTNLDAQDVERAAATVNDELAETREALAALERGSIARKLQREWWEQFVRVERAFVNTDLPSPIVKWSDLPQKWWDAVEATKDDHDALLQSGAATNTVERIREFLSQGDLGPVVELLQLRVKLTGRNTFEVEGWVTSYRTGWLSL